MILIHEKALRGKTRMGWLDSQHTFSFGAFNDPTRMGFGNLRVLNEDHIAPGSGFAPHDHASMDILTYVIDGALRHEDSEGNVSEIHAGQMQLMSAGDGIRHAEWNASETAPAHFLQIWMIPDHPGGRPTYAETELPQTGDVVLAGGKSSSALLPLRSDSQLELRRFKTGDRFALAADADNNRFVHLLDGLADAEGERISAGDALQMPVGEETTLTWHSEGAVLLFTMPQPQRRILQ